QTTRLPMDRIKGYTEVAKLLADPNVHVVDVCLPTPAHVDIVTAALAAGKHVLCEKPMALNSADAQKIADAADAATGLFMPCMCMRFWAEWEWLRKAVETQKYGKVKSAVFRRLGVVPQGWFRNGKLSGGGIVDLHIHDVDFAYSLFGTPKSVYASGYVGPTGEIDHVVAQYRYDAGAAAGATVAAEGGWTQADGFGFRMQYLVNFEGATADFDIGRKPTLQLHKDGKTDAVETHGRDGYVGELTYFLDCVRHGTKPAVVTAADAVAGLKIVEAEKRSIASGQPEAV
ncbi:MAG: putative oxidoreductase, partial [Phycisphaerales bacterium]|nr:putative oxidoreductase [Phycisphaerales bacterium]